jgi:hypothetical protein
MKHAMSVPESLQSVLDTVIGEVRADPQHRMSPQRRCEVYDAFNCSADATMQQAPCWLAVVTAKRVLPIFQQRYPDDTSPQELLETAIGVLQGQVDDARAYEMLDSGYLASANAWGYDDREIPWPTWLAGNAAYHALKEAHGYQYDYRPLSNLPDYYKGDVLTPWSDEDLCEMDFADTAAVAAIASASDRYGRAYNPEELLAFWTWWLTEAIPMAIEAARRGQLPADD